MFQRFVIVIVLPSLLSCRRQEPSLVASDAATPAMRLFIVTETSIATYPFEAFSDPVDVRITGRMTESDRIDSGGSIPRSFDISPDGKHVAVANEDTGEVTEIQLDDSNGKFGRLTQLGRVSVPHFITFY